MFLLSLSVACVPGWGPPGVVSAQTDRPAAGTDLYGDPLPPGAVSRLGTVRYRQDSPIYRIAYTPDGKHFLTDGQDSLIRVWDAATGRIVRRIDPAVGVLDDFALTIRGTRLMAAGRTAEPDRGFVRHVAMIDIDSGLAADQASWVAEGPGFAAVAVCAERQYIATGLDPHGVRVLDAWNGAEVCRFETGQRRPQRIVFSRDGKRLAVETHGGKPGENRIELRLYDLDPRQELRVIAQEGFFFSQLRFSPDGRTIAATSGIGLNVWDVETGERISFDKALIDHVDYSADGHRLVGMAGFGSIGIFDLAARRESASFRTGLADGGEVALSPDGRTLVANNGEIALHSWDLEQRRDRFATPGAPEGPAEVIMASPDGKTLFTAGRDHAVRIWDLGTSRCSRTLRLSGPAAVAALSPGGRRLAAATFIHHQVFVWDLEKGTGPVVLAYGTGLDVISPLAARFVDDRTLVILDQAARVHRLELEALRVKPGSTLQLSPPAPDRPRTGDDRLRRAVFLAGGSKVVAHGIFTGLHVCDAETGKEQLHAEGGDRLEASPDGRFLAVAKLAGEQKLGRLARLAGHKTGFELTWPGGLIRILDAETGRERTRMTVEGSQVWALAFSPDGKTLAATSGSETGRIHLFDVDGGKEVRTIDAPPMRSPALAFTPDGRRLITAMADTSVLIWDLRPAR